MASNTGSSASRIELLSKENYDTWTIQIEAWLRRNGLWKYVDGTTVKPARGSSAVPTEALTNWIEKDDQARTELILSIQPRLLKDIKHCKTSNEIWIKLQSVYASTGPAKKAALLKQLIQRKMCEGSDVRDHMDGFFETTDKLVSMGEVISDNLQTVILLNSLPPSYQAFRTAIETRDTLPSPKELKVKILEYNESTREESGNDLVAMAFCPKKGHVQSGGKREFRCYKCGGKGHKANACPSK
ncbi:GSCOCG00012223001-RA-CDS, partial [Cotesia congregata]